MTLIYNRPYLAESSAEFKSTRYTREIDRDPRVALPKLYQFKRPDGVTKLVFL